MIQAAQTAFKEPLWNIFFLLILKNENYATQMQDDIELMRLQV